MLSEHFLAISCQLPIIKISREVSRKLQIPGGLQQAGRHLSGCCRVEKGLQGGINQVGDVEQMLQSLNGCCRMQKWPGKSTGVEMTTAGWESV